MKKRVFMGSILFLTVFSGSMFSLASEKQPDWSGIYSKETAIAKGWKYIIIHHSATTAGSAKAFHKYHTDQGYGGLSYHFVIGNGNGSPDGKVEAGFRWKEQISGTHVDINSWYHNVFGIGICLVGNFDKTSPTKSQIGALKQLVGQLSEKYDISKENIMGHTDVPFGEMRWDSEKISVMFKKDKTAQTHCPGKNFSALLGLGL